MKKINFIAELCQNHLGKMKHVEKMLDECASSGAKIIKLQYKHGFCKVRPSNKTNRK